MMRWEEYGGVGREARNGIGKEGCEGKNGKGDTTDAVRPSI